jgi:hypothetical protein
MVRQYVSVSSPLWDLRPDITSCRKVAVLFLWGALSDKGTGLQFLVQSLIGPSHAEPVTILYCLIWDFPNLEGQVPVLIYPGNSVAQLNTQALRSLYVVFYGSTLNSFLYVIERTSLARLLKYKKRMRKL